MIKVKNYLSLIKFSHTIFALPFALIGFFIAIVKNGVEVFVKNGGYVKMHFYVKLDETFGEDALFRKTFWQIVGTKFIYVLLCMIFARSAAMAFNRYLDRNFDAKNPRTAIREIPAGIISSNSALRFTILMSVLFIGTTYLINPICFYLSPVALFVVLGYSFTKRFTPLCHLVLGVGLALAPIGAYLAVTGQFAILPILFSFTVLFWVSGFDIIYALQDEEFDKKYELKSIPAWLGKTKALRVSEFLHLLAAACVIAAGVYGQFGWLYWIGVAVFVGMLIYQHSIVKPDDLRKVNIAFMTANGIASVVFAVFVIADIVIG